MKEGQHMLINGGKYIPYQQAQQLAGVGRSKLQTLVRAGVIAAYKPGKMVLLSVCDLEAWIESTRLLPRRIQGRPRKHGTRRMA